MYLIFARMLWDEDHTVPRQVSASRSSGSQYARAVVWFCTDVFKWVTDHIMPGQKPGLMRLPCYRAPANGSTELSPGELTGACGCGAAG